MLTTFREMQRRVQQRIQNDSSSVSDSINDLLPKLKVWTNERYERIFEAKPWRQLIKKSTLSIVASQTDYVLPRDYGRIISIFDQTNGLPIQESSVQEHIRFRAAVLDVTGDVQTGDPKDYFKIGEYTVKAEIGNSAEKVALVSSSSADVSPLVVHIVGLVSTVEVSEDVVVTGTSSVQSTNTYDANQKLQITIGTNDGTEPELSGVITASGATSSTVFAQISKFDIGTPYTWIRVSPTPKATGTQPTWDTWYRRRFRRLISDNDVPIFDCCTAIIQGVYSDALREDGQESAADSADNKFVGLVEELWANENTGDRLEQFIPYSFDVYKVDEYQRANFLG